MVRFLLAALFLPHHAWRMEALNAALLCHLQAEQDASDPENQTSVKQSLLINVSLLLAHMLCSLKRSTLRTLRLRAQTLLCSCLTPSL